jgi:hypothetical protein
MMPNRSNRGRRYVDLVALFSSLAAAATALGPLAGLAAEAGAAPPALSAAPQPSKPQPRYNEPNLNPTQVPTAFVAEWGNYFISSSYYAYDSGYHNGMVSDGSLNLGVGAGDARRLVALELDFNLESLADSRNGGSLDLRLGRSLISRPHFRLQLGGGWLGVASYGNWPKPGGSPYGVLSAAWPLRPNDANFPQTLQINLGGGSGRFQRLDAVDLSSDGVFGSIGVALTPNLGISAGWAGKGVNTSLSYVPIRGLPLFLTLSGANITNVDASGRAVAFSLSWGGSFRTATFPAAAGGN